MNSLDQWRRENMEIDQIVFLDNQLSAKVVTTSLQHNACL